VKILLFVLVPAVLVAAYAVAMAWRNRQPTSVESGVDAFRREMSALSPHQAPEHRRPGEAPPAGPPGPVDRQRRPPGRRPPEAGPGPSAPPGAR